MTVFAIRVWDTVRAIGWRWLLIGLAAGIGAVGTWIALEPGGQVEAEGQVGLGSGADFFDLDPMQTVVEQRLDDDEFAELVAARSGVTSVVRLTADRSLGTRSFITVRAEGGQRDDVLATLDAALLQLVDEYNAVLVADVTAEEQLRDELESEIASLDAQISELITIESAYAQTRNDDERAYAIYEQARTDRSVLERERNSLVDEANIVRARINEGTAGVDSSSQLRVLVAATVTDDDSTRALAALAAGVGVGAIGVVAVAVSGHGRMPARTERDLESVGAPISEVPYDFDGRSQVLTYLRRQDHQVKSIVIVGEPGASRTVQADLVDHLPERPVAVVYMDDQGRFETGDALAEATHAVLALGAGTSTIGAAGRAADDLRSLGIELAGSVIVP